MKLWLGTHQTGWLATAGVPLMVSHRRLAQRRRLPVAAVPWVLDSGGFTELSMHGRWTVEPAAYVDSVRRYRDDIGRLEWAAPQDWMCEPFIVAKTGLTVAGHQRRTVANFVRLRSEAPDCPWIPVVQGWTLADYLACVQFYREAGVDLAAEQVVGVGSVCRRQGTAEAALIMRALHGLGLRTHGFGFKAQAIERCRDVVTSADSLAWSYQARRNPGLLGCTHRSCANCLAYALRWRDRLERRMAQAALFEGAA